MSGPPQVINTTNKPFVVAVGLPGPRGPAGPSGGEEEAVYAKRVDMQSDTLLYRGEAAVGTLDATPAWRIRRITIALDGDVTEQWADGSAEFNKAWLDRETITYT